MSKHPARFGIDIKDGAIDFKDVGFDALQQELLKKIDEAYKKKEQELGVELLRLLEKMVMLRTIDTLWKDHLLGIDSLREGIGLRGYGQKDPLDAVLLLRSLLAEVRSLHVKVDALTQQRASLAHPLEPVLQVIATATRSLPFLSGELWDHAALDSALAETLATWTPQTLGIALSNAEGLRIGNHCVMREVETREGVSWRIV